MSTLAGGSSATVADPADLDGVDFNDVFFEGPDEQRPSNLNTPDPAEKEGGGQGANYVAPKKDEGVPDPNAEKPAGEEEEGKDDVTTDDDTPLALIDEVRQLAGLEDLEGEFADDPKGIADLIVKGGEQFATEYLEEYYMAHPQMKELHEFLRDGGKFEDFMHVVSPDVDYSKVVVKDDDYDQHEAIIREAYKQRGVSDEQIKTMLETFKSNNLTAQQAKVELEALKQSQSRSKETLIAQQKVESEAAQKETEEFWNGIKKTVKESNDFSGLVISVKDRDDFFNFLSKPDAAHNGYTRRDVAASQLSKDQMLMMDALLYLVMEKKADFKSLINRAAATNNAKSLRERIEQDRNNRLAGGQSDRVGNNSNNLEDVDFEALN